MVFGGCDFAQRFVDVSRKESQSFHAKMRKVLNLWRKVSRKKSQRFEFVGICEICGEICGEIFTQRFAKFSRKGAQSSESVA